MFNVQSKTYRSQFRLLHEPNEKVNGKTKKKTIEQYRVYEGSLMDGVGSKVGRIFVKCSFEQEWKRVGVIDGYSGDDWRDELR